MRTNFGRNLQMIQWKGLLVIILFPVYLIMALTDSGTRDKPRKLWKPWKQDLIDFMSDYLDDKTDDGRV